MSFPLPSTLRVDTAISAHPLGTAKKDFSSPSLMIQYTPVLLPVLWTDMSKFNHIGIRHYAFSPMWSDVEIVLGSSLQGKT